MSFKNINLSLLPNRPILFTLDLLLPLLPISRNGKAALSAAQAFDSPLTQCLLYKSVSLSTFLWSHCHHTSPGCSHLLPRLLEQLHSLSACFQFCCFSTVKSERCHPTVNPFTSSLCPERLWLSISLRQDKVLTFAIIYTSFPPWAGYRLSFQPHHLLILSSCSTLVIGNYFISFCIYLIVTTKTTRTLLAFLQSFPLFFRTEMLPPPESLKCDWRATHTLHSVLSLSHFSS